MEELTGRRFWSPEMSRTAVLRSGVDRFGAPVAPQMNGGQTRARRDAGLAMVATASPRSSPSGEDGRRGRRLPR